MNENNYDYLNRQLLGHGFGEGHAAELKEKMIKGAPEFTLFHEQQFGKDSTVATLQFRKPENGDLYFFNRYSLLLKNEQYPDAIKQNFYINHKQDNTTLKEAYNMMSGRAVLKNLKTREDVPYQTWVQLDFKNQDAQGSFKEIKHSMDLEKVLSKYPIRELDNNEHRGRLMESLQRGNRQSVTLLAEGKETKIFIEAAPQFKSLNFYDSEGKRLHTQSVVEKKTEGQSETKEHKENKKEAQQQKPSDDDLDTGKNSVKKNNRKHQGIS